MNPDVRGPLLLIYAILLLHAGCSAHRSAAYPTSENSPPQSGIGGRAMIYSPEVATSYANMYEVVDGQVLRSGILGREIVPVHGLWVLLPGNSQVLAQYFSFDRIDGWRNHRIDGLRFGYSRVWWSRGVLAASLGARGSVFTSWYSWYDYDESGLVQSEKHLEKADGWLLELPVLLGARRVFQTRSRWIWLSGHAYTGAKLIGGRARFWLGDPRVRRSDPILGIRAPIIGVGASLLGLYVSAEASPVLAFLPVVDTHQSWSLVPFGLSIEFMPKDE